MTDPEMADATYIEPVTWQMVEKIIEIERPDALLPTMGGQTALNCALDLAKHGVLEKYGVEMIGAKKEAIDKAEDREKFKQAMTAHRARHAALRARPLPGGSAAGSGDGWLPDDHPAFVHARRHRRRHRVQPRRVSGHLRARAGCIADQGAPDRRVGDRLERIRDGGGSRFRKRQLHHRLLDREPRPDGCAHRRLDHGRPGADADRQGIPDHARCIDRGIARDRRRHGRFERPVRHQSRRRAHGRDRDEPARVAIVRACVESNRLPDREGRGEARCRLHAGRTQERHHRRRDAGVIRADDRLRRHQGAAFRVREVSAGERPSHHPDEVRGRGDGHRPHLPGIVAEGAARPRGGRRRPQPEDDRPRDHREGAGRARTGAHLVRGRCVREWLHTRRSARTHAHRPVVPRSDRRDRLHRDGAGRPSPRRSRRRGATPPQAQGIFRSQAREAAEDG